MNIRPRRELTRLSFSSLRLYTQYSRSGHKGTVFCISRHVTCISAVSAARVLFKGRFYALALSPVPWRSCQDMGDDKPTPVLLSLLGLLSCHEKWGSPTSCRGQPGSRQDLLKKVIGSNHPVVVKGHNSPCQSRVNCFVIHRCTATMHLGCGCQWSAANGARGYLLSHFRLLSQPSSPPCPTTTTGMPLAGELNKYVDFPCTLLPRQLNSSSSNWELHHYLPISHSQHVCMPQY